jgi:hypothetical protein
MPLHYTPKPNYPMGAEGLEPPMFLRGWVTATCNRRYATRPDILFSRVTGGSRTRVDLVHSQTPVPLGYNHHQPTIGVGGIEPPT